jgi:hypothetical protein
MCSSGARHRVFLPCCDPSSSESEPTVDMSGDIYNLLDIFHAVELREFSFFFLIIVSGLQQL